MSPNSVEIDGRLLRIGNECGPLVSGEVQFWRMAPETWRSALEATREAGIQVVATYLSWRRHEPTRGSFEWGANEPQLNAKEFVRLCHEVGLSVHIKPGPWICAEEPGGGYPDWLLDDDELVALDGWGKPVVGYNPPFLHRVPSYRHPGYRNAVRNWFTEVWRELGDFRYPNGPIVAVQLDNEPSYCFAHALYYSDYHPIQIRAFREWLDKNYLNDAHLSDAWGTSTTFQTAEPPRPDDKISVLGDHGVPNQKLADWADFCGETITDHLRFIQDEHNRLGATSLLPTVNIVNPPILEVPLSHTAIRNATGATTGADHYYFPPLDLTDIDRLAKTAAFARLAGEPLVWAPELMAGIWRSPGEDVQYPDPTATEQAAWWGAAMGLGYQGFNFYMLVNRENWEFAPLGEGENADFLAATEKLTELISRTPDLARSQPIPGVALAWHRPDAIAAWSVTGTERGNPAVHNDPKARAGYDSWFQAGFDLLKNGVPYDLVDTSATASPSPSSSKTLLIPARSGADDERLAKFGWNVRRLNEGESVESLIESGQIQPPLRVTPNNLPQFLASITRGQCGVYLHLVNWGEERSVKLEVSEPWGNHKWANLSERNAQVCLDSLTVPTGHTVLASSGHNLSQQSDGEKQ